MRAWVGLIWLLAACADGDPKDPDTDSDPDTVPETDVPVDTDVDDSDSGDTESDPAETDETDAVDTDVVDTDVVDTDPADTDVVDTDPLDTDVVETDVVDTDRVDTDVVDTDVVDSDRVDTDVVETDVVDSDRVETAGDTAETGPGGADDSGAADSDPDETATPDSDPSETDGADSDSDPVETDPVDSDSLETDAADTGVAETDVVETDPAETDRVETDPAETDPADTDLADTDVADTDPADTDLADTDVADTDPADTDVADTDPADTDLADTDVADTDPADTDVADTDVADTDPTDTDVADTDVADTDPADTDLVDTDPAETGAADTDTAVDTSDSDSDVGETADTGPADTGPAETDVVDTDPADTDVVDTDPRDTGAVDTDPAETDVVDTDPAETDVVDTDPVDTDVVDTDPADTDPVDTDVVDTDPADTDVVDTDPADTDAVDTDPVDTDVIETDVVDTDTGDSDTAADTGPVCPDLAWWPGEDLDGDGAGDLPFRVLMDMVAPGTDLERAPVPADVDFASALAALGEAGSVDPASVRVVLQRCDLGYPEQPSQWVDALVQLDEKVEHASPIGDGRGTVLFIYDEDGDPLTDHVLPAGARARVAVYFSTIERTGGSVPAPAYPGEATATQTELRTGRSTAVFDPARGGVLHGLALDGSMELTSQGDACCGNSMFSFTPGGWVDPMDGPGDVEVIADGPLLAAVRSTGTRTQADATQVWGEYDFDLLYWAVAGRPELMHVTTQTTTRDSSNTHIVDATQGFRPWESRQQALLAAGPLTYERDLAEGWASITGAEWGVAVGMAQRARYVHAIENPLPRVNPGFFFDYLAFYANDWIDFGAGTPVVVPEGTTYFDHIGFVVLPYAGPWADQRGTLLSLMSFVQTTGATPQRR